MLSGTDPTLVLARAAVPPLPYTQPWEAGIRPQWPCNTRHVSNLGGGHRVGSPNPLGRPGDDLFRVCKDIDARPGRSDPPALKCITWACNVTAHSFARDRLRRTLSRADFGGADAVIGTALISVQLASASNNSFRCAASGVPGLAQCVVDNGGSAPFGSFAACEVALRAGLAHGGHLVCAAQGSPRIDREICR